MASPSFVSQSGDSKIDGLLYTYKWSGSSINVQFPSSSNAYSEGEYVGANISGFSQISSQGRERFELVFDQIESFTNLDINIVSSTSNNADVRISSARSIGGETINTGYAFLPDFSNLAGDVWLDRSFRDLGEYGTYEFILALHEFGHAIGLNHPHDSDGGFPVLSTQYDALQNTVMSYRSYLGHPLPRENSNVPQGYLNGEFDFPETYMMLDIAALQYNYGANYSFNSGNDTYNFDPNEGVIFRTLWDGNGNDTYDFSRYSTNLSINLNPGEWSNTKASGNGRDQRAELDAGRSGSTREFAPGNVANALLFEGDTRSLIENAIGGSGDDVIYGNIKGNRLEGRGGNDILKGGSGRDTLVGGIGSDRLEGGSGADIASYTASNSRVDIRLEAGIGRGGHAQGDTFFSVEYVLGSRYNDYISGTQGNNALNGLNGNDHLRGNGGADRLNGGEGIDLVSYSNSNGRVDIRLDLNSANGGHATGDTLISIENVFGSRYNDYLSGNNGNNALNGGNGNDHLRGNAGADRLNGSNGIDLANYVNSNARVDIRLDASSASGGHAQGDTLISIENLLGSLYDDYLSGSPGNNVLNGWNGNDYLRGNAGADRLNGGEGIDVANYNNSNARVDVRLDSNVARGGHATGDTLINIENLVGSKFNDYLSGDGTSNLLHGWDGNDYLRGNAGADILNGGNGLDVANYHNSDAAVNVDLTLNTTAGGHAQGDTLISIENLVGSQFNDTLIGDEKNNLLNGWRGDDTLIGALGDDTLIGSDGNDVLFGGLGVNRYTGGEGADIFYFEDINGLNTVLDFDGLEGDKIAFSSSSGIIDIADLRDNHVSADVSGDAVINYSGNSIILSSTALVDLEDINFLFDYTIV